MIASIVTEKKCIVMILCVIVSSNEKCNTWIVNYKLRSDTCLLVYVIYLFSCSLDRRAHTYSAPVPLRYVAVTVQTPNH